MMKPLTEILYSYLDLVFHIRVGIIFLGCGSSFHSWFKLSNPVKVNLDPGSLVQKFNNLNPDRKLEPTYADPWSILQIIIKTLCFI